MHTMEAIGDLSLNPIGSFLNSNEGSGMSDDYMEFLARKAVKARQRGLTGNKARTETEHLFPFQRQCVDFALRMGAAGIYLDTGLGKSEIQLDWCHRAIEATGERALILTPLAVAKQFERRADRWGYDARVIREQSEARPGINICNYDRLGKIDPSEFGIISLDESSIIKNFTGKTTRAIIDAFSHHRFKMSATATPAPNDHMELGNQSEFLGVMTGNEMLSRFFINDTSTASQEWRIKHHAINAFWDWMASWARMAELPSDLTGNKQHDADYMLPQFKVIRHRARESDVAKKLGGLFADVSVSATSIHDIKRQTTAARADLAASLIDLDPTEYWLIWCDTNYEADAIRDRVADAVDVRGSQSIEQKEEHLDAFSTGSVKRIITKPSLAGFGLDWSHVARMIFVGRTFSYETWYQAVRRAWRYGQKRELQVHLIVAEGEDEIGRVIERKADGHSAMRLAMRDAMRRACGISSSVKNPYDPKHIGELPSWISAA